MRAPATRSRTRSRATSRSAITCCANSPSQPEPYAQITGNLLNPRGVIKALAEGRIDVGPLDCAAYRRSRQRSSRSRARCASSTRPIRRPCRRSSLRPTSATPPLRRAYARPFSRHEEPSLDAQDPAARSLRRARSGCLSRAAGARRGRSSRRGLVVSLSTIRIDWQRSRCHNFRRRPSFWCLAKNQQSPERTALHRSVALPEEVMRAVTASRVSVLNCGCGVDAPQLHSRNRISQPSLSAAVPCLGGSGNDMVGRLVTDDLEHGFRAAVAAEVRLQGAAHRHVQRGRAGDPAPRGRFTAWSGECRARRRDAPGGTEQRFVVPQLIERQVDHAIGVFRQQLDAFVGARLDPRLARRLMAALSVCAPG